MSRKMQNIWMNEKTKRKMPVEQIAGKNYKMRFWLV